ncbi:hypothetical protein ACH5RR_038036 [Cinchona calisaya]|uniref:Viral late gene transcription factor 3 zinc ribbon domain-containing protein n=1 Tax=Cinchona calisaya TaxID=153742 RepID=A0ABD2YAX0_9GENT
MEAASAFALVNSFPARSSNHRTKQSQQIFLVPGRNDGTNYSSVKTKKLESSRIFAAAEVSGFVLDPAQSVVTWQIVVGALAGVTPFMVAGIEFGKRIVKQRQCGECKGSGLVLRNDQQYIKCPACGGWLPWQSWRRFFTG